MNYGAPSAPKNAFSLKLEDLAVRYYAPKNVKKCYIKLIYNGSRDWANGKRIPFKFTKPETILANPVKYANETFKKQYKNFKLHCKSFSWSLVPVAQLPYFKAMAMFILCCEQFDPQTLFMQFKNKLYTDLCEIISQQHPEIVKANGKTAKLQKTLEILEPYTLQVKSIRVPHIIEEHPDLKQYNQLRVLWLNGGKKDKGRKNLRRSAVAKLQPKDLCKINILELMGNTIGLMKKLAGIKLTLKDKRDMFIRSQDDQETLTNIPVRISSFDGSENSIYIDLEKAFEVIEELKDSGSVHEICEDYQGYYRFFMDIDTHENDKVIDIEKIETKLVTIVRQIFNINLSLLFIQKSDKSQAFHVYGNFATTIPMMKQIVQGIDKSIDLKVYKRNTSLRMCNVFKTNQKDKKIINTFYPATKEQYPNTLLNNIEGLKIVKENIGLSCIPHIATYNITSKFGQEITDKLTELLQVPFELKPADGYSGMSCIIQQSYKCPVTGNLHKSNNAYISKHFDKNHIASVIY